MPPTKQDFENALNTILQQARNIPGVVGVVVRSGDLHRYVGGYPGRDHRMPLCCEVMKEKMQPSDQILNSPSSGQGANLEILYKF